MRGERRTANSSAFAGSAEALRALDRRAHVRGKPTRVAREKAGLGVEYVEHGGDSAERVRSHLRTEAQAVVAGLREAGLLKENPTLGKRLRQAYAKRAAVETARAEVRREAGDDWEQYHREALRRELALLEEWGIVGKQRAVDRTVAETGTLEDVRAWRQVVTDDGFEDLYLALLREARDAAGVDS